MHPREITLHYSFHAELTTETPAKADVKVIGYPEAEHAFTNADKAGLPPVSYNKAADEKSWKDMQAFFIELLGPPTPKP